MKPNYDMIDYNNHDEVDCKEFFINKNNENKEINGINENNEKNENNNAKINYERIFYFGYNNNNNNYGIGRIFQHFQGHP